MNILLWIFQILLALHTIMGAMWKFSNSEQTVFSFKVLPHPLWITLCVFEILCSIGLIFPAFSSRFRRLVPLAALGIALEMLFLCGVHLYAKDPNQGPMIYWLVVAAVSAFIAYGRIKLRPL